MRLFVAINLPAAEREAIHRASGLLRSAGLPVRWVASESMHVTLEFIGAIPEQRVARIVPVLDEAAADVASFRIDASGIGGFPSLRNPRVIWLGVEPADALIQLQARVSAGLSGLELKVDHRPYHPHVTLGRCQADARASDFAGLAGIAGRIPARATAVIDSVDLMQSRLGRGGARYEVVHRALLGRQTETGDA